MQSANGVWLAFPVTEVIAAVISVLVYKRQHHDTEG
jgi:Na+-driven multidrug efflux pump